MKKYLLIVLTSLGILLFSCQDDFMDVDQQENILSDTESINNDAGAKAFATSVYSVFLTWDMSTFSWIGMTSIASDDADKGSEPGDTGSDKHLLDNLEWNSSSPSIEQVFSANYNGIGKANQVLLTLPQLDQADPALRSRLIGEVKFLRAFMYFNLVRLFGDIPLVDRVPNPGLDEDKLMLLQRRPKNEIYDFIEQDLQDAIASLPNKSAYPQDERARVSVGSALALMAKVKLYRQQWSDVISFTNQISGYNLVNDYASIFRETGEFNAESLFEINGYAGDPARGIQQYSQCQGARGSGGWGWGFNTPSASLLQAYESNDTRKDATIIFAGQTLWDGRVVPATVFNPRYNYKAYSTVNPGGDNTDTNIRYLRYAEVLLMRAEAFNELGQTSNALTELNKVRNRAGLPNFTSTDQVLVRKAIWKERRVELAFEHDRWFDLIRTGQATEFFEIHGKNFISGKHELYPIPQSFINQSEGVTTQNPGY